MAVERKKIINQLAVFTDPVALKVKYGITATPAQIETAKKTLRSYQTMSDLDLKKISEQVASKWPFQLTEEQRYDKLLHKADLTMSQQIMWQNIRSYLSKNPNERKTDRTCILKAMNDLEGFLQLNAYLGNFEENEKLIQGKDISYVMKLFNLSYSKYLTEKQREEKYNNK